MKKYKKHKKSKHDTFLMDVMFLSLARLGLRRRCGMVDINVRYLLSNVDTRFLVRFNYGLLCQVPGGTFSSVAGE